MTYSTPAGACSDATTTFFDPRMSEDLTAPVGPPNPSCCKGANKGLCMSSAGRVKNWACKTCSTSHDSNNGKSRAYLEMLSAPKLMTQKHTRRSFVVNRLSSRSAKQNCTCDTLYISALIMVADASGPDSRLPGIEMKCNVEQISVHSH